MGDMTAAYKLFICVLRFFCKKYYLIKGGGSSIAFKGHVICVWQFFFAKSLLKKGRWVKGRHLRLKDASFVFGIFFLQNLFLKKEGGLKDVNAFKGHVICV